MEEEYNYAASEITILDRLNSDCWREIFSYVPVVDIVRSERVSQVWRERVLEYMQGVQLSVEYLQPCIIMNILNWDRHPNSRLLTLDREESPDHHQERMFTKLVSKLGSNIIFIGTDRIDETDVGSIIWHCPNLEILLLCSIEYYLPLDQLKCCRKLKRVSFHSCTIPDEYICQLLDNVPIKELIINNASYVSGMFLAEPKDSKLEHLSISSCYLLMTEFFRTATDLEGLTRLELVLNSVEVYRNVHLLLDNTPNLEHLSLVTFDKKTNVGSEFVDSLSKLKRLKHFYARFINNANEGWLEDIAVGCTALETLDVGNCTGVTARSLQSFCRARGAALTELGVAWNNHLTDDQLADCIALCPNLKTLDVQGCVQVTTRLVETVRDNPRYWPLCLRLRRTKVPMELRAECLWLILDFGY